MKKKILLVLGIVFALLLAACVVLTVIISNSSSLVSDTGIKTGQQNNTLTYDGEHDILFVGTRTGTVMAFDNASKEKLWEFTAEAGQPITSIKVHPATGKVYAGSDDMFIYTFDIKTGEQIADPMDIQRRVVDIDINSDETLVALLTHTNTTSNIIIKDIATGDNLMNEKKSYDQKYVLFTEAEDGIMVADKRGQMTVYELAGSTRCKLTDGLQQEVFSMRRTVDGQYFICDLLGNYAVVNENCEMTRKGAVTMIDGAYVRSGDIDEAGNVIIGTKQGYIYVANADNEQIYETRQAGNYHVSDFVADGETMYMTGFGDFVDSLQLASLETIATLTKFGDLIKIVLACSAVLSVACLLCYFKASYKFVCKVGHILWKHKIAYLLLIPTFALLIMFNYTPMVIALSRAFTNWSQNRYSRADFEFVGFYNFKRMFTEGYFLTGVENMLILMVTGFAKSLTMPILAAWLVYSFNKDRKKFIYRFLFVLPIVVPGLVGSLLWKQIYNPGGGLDQILKAIGRPDLIHVWLGEAKTAIWSIVWMGPPYIGAMPFLLYYGGFTSIDSSLYEAAKIDGASRWKIFWRIQLPMVRPQMKLLIMLQFIGSIQDYGGIYLLTGGGPGTATYVPGLELYYNATTFGNYGYACAMGLVMFIVIMIGTFFNNKIKAENYGS